MAAMRMTMPRRFGATALMALLDGTLLLSFLDPDAHAQQLRRQGLREIAALLLESAASA